MKNQQGVEKDNNRKDIPLQEFIRLIQGNNSDYLYISGPNRASEQQREREASEKGEYYIPTSVTIPPPKWSFREKPMLEQSGPVMGKPDPKKPYIHEIHGDIYLSKYNQLETQKEKKLNQLVLPRPISMRDCFFFGDLLFDDVYSKFDLVFSSCKFFKKDKNNKNVARVQFDRCSINNISFFSCTTDSYQEDGFLESLTINSITASQVVLNKCRLNKLIINTKSGSIDSIQIIDCFIKEIELSGENIQECVISNLSENECINIKSTYKILTISSEIEPEDLSKHSIGKFIIHFFNQTEKGSLIVRNMSIKHIELTGVSNGDVLMKAVKVRYFSANEFSNLGYFRLHKLSNIHEFILQDVSLGKADMMDVNLSQAQMVQITHSSVSDIILNNTVFPKTIIANDEDDFSGIREAYRQLKYASNKQGNRIRELEYEALEMDAYEKDTSIQKSFVDKSILFTNKWSNNHGQDWSRALGFLVVLTWIAFFIIKYSQGYRLALVSPDIGQIDQYLNFAFNPLHDFNTLFNPPLKHNSPWIKLAKFVDTITRLLSGYLLFQFIRAFRKFVKESS